MKMTCATSTNAIAMRVFELRSRDRFAKLRVR